MNHRSNHVTEDVWRGVGQGDEGYGAGEAIGEEDLPDLGESRARWGSVVASAVL